jgi:hypothetical protein
MIWYDMMSKDVERTEAAAFLHNYFMF